MNRKKWLLSVMLLAFGLGTIYQILVYVRVAEYAKQGHWAEEKVSKVIALEQQLQNPSIGFVGSSTTLNHVDTDYLSRNGVTALNYALNGRAISDHIYTIDAMLNQGVDVIVVSLPGVLLNRAPTFPDGMTISEAIIYMKSGLNLWAKDELLISVLKNAIPSVRFERFVGRLDRDLGNTTVMNTEIQQKYKVKLNPDDLNYIRKRYWHYVVTMKNGDGILFATLNKRKIAEDKRTPLIKRFNSKTYAFLMFLQNWIESRGSEMVLVIQPSGYNSDVTLGAPVVKRLKRFKYVVDLSSASSVKSKMKYRDWADVSHYSYSGRAKYTQAIYSGIKRLRIPSLETW